MSRARRRWLAAAAAAAVVAVAVLLPLAGGAADDGAVPTVVVQPQRLLRTVAAEGVLEAVDSVTISLPPSVRMPMRLAWMAEDGSLVVAGQPVARFDATEMEKSLVDARDDLRAAELRREREHAQSASELTRLDQDARLAGLELSDAQEFQKKDETIFSRHEIVESDIDEELAGRRREHALAARRSRERLAEAELELVAIERREAGHAIERAQEGLDALELTAPRDGVVLFSRDWRGELVQVGETMWPGGELAEIPDLRRMKAQVWVLEADAGGLATGQPAEVVVEAHPERRYAATVQRVDALAKPRQRGSPVQYFAATLELAETVPEVMKPGQRVRATIDLGRVESALVVPRQAVFPLDGANVVYRRTAAGGFEPVAVELGPGVAGRVTVTSGLAAGDEVALVDPTAAAEEPEAADAAPGVELPAPAGETP